MHLIDPCGHLVKCNQPAKRIVSLVPSITETLFEIGGGSQVVGVSSYCTDPVDLIQFLPKLGGPKNPDLELIDSLNPDLILLNREENRIEHYCYLSERYPVYVSDVRRISDVPDLLRHLGFLTGCDSKAEVFALRIAKTLFTAHDSTDMHNYRAVALVWNSPLMTANGDTYLADWLSRAGVVNPFFDRVERYPIVSLESVAQENPEFIIFPSEPYCWSNSEINSMVERLAEYGCCTKPIKIEGKSLIWYGFRTIESIEMELPSFIRSLSEA